MSLFKRLFTLGKAETNAVIEKLEDPIKMTEQGIRDMKADLEKTLKALAEVKALAIRSRNELSAETDKAKDYEKKAMMLLQRAESGQITAVEADRLATEALTRKTECENNVARLKKDQTKFEADVAKIENNVKTLRSKISTYENELKTLKARVKVATSTKNLNKQMAAIDSTDTIAMLERMKDKVQQEEALADAYGDIANESRSLDEEIDKAIGDPTEEEATDRLAELKAKMAAAKGGNS